MMKNSVFNYSIYISIVLTLLVNTSCKTNSNVKIGFLTPYNYEGSRWINDEKYISEAGKANGVQVMTRSANNDENLQLKQAQELIDEGVDVLIVVPINQITAAEIVRNAHKAGVKVIAYDRIISNCELDYYVTFKSYEIGKLMLDYALQHKPQGNYVILWGDAMDANAMAIKKTQEEILKPYIENKSINIVYKRLIDDWSKENANHIMKRVVNLSTVKIDAVITSYDGLAIGAIEAFEEAGISTADMIITGQDANLEACRAIIDGRMSLTVYKSIKKISKTSVDLAIKIAKKQRVKEVNSSINNGSLDVPSVLLSPIAVDANNIVEVLTGDGFYTQEQLYGVQN